MKCLNSSYKDACLHCSFSDKELSQYIQFKKEACAHNLTKKYSVSSVGLQSDGTWVMSRNVHLSKDGMLLEPADSQYIWIGHIFNGPGVACDSEECTVELPLSTDPLCSLIEGLKSHTKHNFIPFVMTIAGTILALHYQKLLAKLKFCPIPLAFGESGTGKTSALLCGLSLIGAQETRFFSKLTKEKILHLCSKSNSPLGVDDPDSKNDISRVFIDLYNGAKSGTMVHGEQKPQSTCVISANFTVSNQQRYLIVC